MDIENSQQIVGYRVKVARRGPFRVRGYTMILPPGKDGDAQIPRLWDEVIRDKRLAKLIGASAVPTWVLGLGSWDPQCPKGGQRYTICIEETQKTDFGPLATAGTLFGKAIGPSDWLCFETELGEEYPARFWRDNPYKMMGRLGYRFNSGERDYSVGLHFEAYPPEFSFGSDKNRRMEFWITVEKVWI